FLLFCSLLLTVSLNAQFRFWVGRTNTDWNNTDNWSIVSQGPGGASVPGVADQVVFDWASPPNDCILNEDATVDQFNMSNGLFSAGSFSITINNNFSLSDGTISLGSGALNARGNTFTVSGGTLNVESGDLSVIPGTFALSGG